MLQILEILADPELATTKFSCDLNACKGACCTMAGGRGAPLEDAEVELIHEATPAALKYLTERNRRIIETEGAIEGSPGDYATRCIDNRDCVFVYYDDQSIAKCAIERAYFNRETTFRKPVSCHLFPIRSTEILGGTYLRYERIRECRPALENGKRENVQLYRFLKDALTRSLGKEGYQELVDSIEKKDKK